MRACYICGRELTQSNAVWLNVPTFYEGKTPRSQAMFCKICAKIATTPTKDPCPKCGGSASCPEGYTCTQKKASLVGDLNANQTV